MAEQRVTLDVSDFQEGISLLDQLAKEYNLDMQSMSIASQRFNKDGKLIGGTLKGLTTSGTAFKAVLRELKDETKLLGVALSDTSRKQQRVEAEQRRALQKADFENKSIEARRGVDALGRRVAGPAIAKASVTELQKFNQTLSTMATLVAKGELSVEELNAVFLKLSSGGIQTFTGASARAARSLRDLQTQARNFGTEAQKAGKHFSKMLADRAKASAVFQDQQRQAIAAFQGSQAASALGNTIAGNRLGLATPQQLAQYNQTLGTLAGLLARGKINAQQLNDVFRQTAQGGIQTFTGASAQAANAINRLRAQVNNFGAQGTSQLQRLTYNLRFFTHVLAAQVIHRAFASITTEMGRGVKEAAEFSKSIAEIRTIAQDNQLAFEQWAGGVRGLSDEFASPLADVAAANYETLSNQVAEGTQSFKFMAESQKFALATNSTLEQSVNLLSSAINGFGLETTDTFRISAAFFKTIDLGRLKAEDLANTFGRVAPLARELGIGFEEVLAVLSVLTRQGVPIDEAMTQLSNLMNATLKPTKAMKTLFKELGVEAGDAAFETYGFAGFLGILAKEAEKGSAELSSLFENIRGRKAVAGLLGNEGEFESDLAQIQGSLTEFGNAVDEVLTNRGFKFQKEVNKIKNFFVVDLGDTALKHLEKLSDFLGVSLSDAAIAATKALGLLAGAATILGGSVAILRGGLLLLNSTFVTTPLGIAAIAAAAAAGVIALKIFSDSLQDTNTAAIEFVTNAENRLLEFENQINAKAAADFKASLDNRFRSFLQFAASMKSTNSKLADELRKQNADVYKDLSRDLDAVVSEAKSRIGELERQIKASEKLRDKALTLEDKFKTNKEQVEVDFQLESLEGAKKHLFILQQLDKIKKEIAATPPGDVAKYEALTERAEELLKLADAQAKADKVSAARQLNKDPLKFDEPARRLPGGFKAEANKAFAAQERMQDNQRKIAERDADDLEAKKKKISAEKELLAIEQVRIAFAETLAAKAKETAQLEEAKTAKLAEQKAIAQKDLKDLERLVAKFDELSLGKKTLTPEEIKQLQKLREQIGEKATPFVDPGDLFDFNRKLNQQVILATKELNTEIRNETIATMAATTEEVNKAIQAGVDKLFAVIKEKAAVFNEENKGLLVKFLAQPVERELDPRRITTPRIRAQQELFLKQSNLQDQLSFTLKNLAQVNISDIDNVTDSFSQLIKATEEFQAKFGGDKVFDDWARRRISFLTEVRTTIQTLGQAMDALSRKNSLINFFQSLSVSANQLQASLSRIAGAFGTAGGQLKDAFFAMFPGQKLADGGPVFGHSGGDRIPILAKRGEFVVNADSAQQFMPLISAINRRDFRGVSNQFGSINVTVNSTASTVNGREVAVAIQRELRRNNIRR